MTLGKTLQIPGAASARQDAQDRHQQQQPLRVTHPSSLASFRQRLKEGDQISSGSGVGQRTGAVSTKPAPAWPHQLTCDGLSVGPGVEIGGTVTGRKDEAPAAVQAAIVNEAGSSSFSGWRQRTFPRSSCRREVLRDRGPLRPFFCGLAV